MSERVTSVGKLSEDRFFNLSFSQSVVLWTSRASFSTSEIRCFFGGVAVINSFVDPVPTFLLRVTDDGSVWLAEQLLPSSAL